MRRIDTQVVVDVLASAEHRGQFALFLGAGCSVGAGVPTATGIINDAKRRLYLMHHDSEGNEFEIETWLATRGIRLNPETAYSQILELIRPTPRLRRSFLEPYFKDRSPSPAHWAMAKLVQAGIFRDLYTTNFDNLIEKSVGQLIPLRVVSYDEQATGSGDFENQPTLYKLHGDYLFDRLANTESELAHLGVSQAARLQAACTRGGLIVVGYSGRDASIMEVLQASAGSGIPLGLYWIALRGEPLAPMVTELLEASSSCHLAESAGFDDLIARVGDSVARGRLMVRAERSLLDNREPFVAHSNGVSALIDKARNALLNSDSSVVCISGLPGVGKTVTARRAVAGLTRSFSSCAIISGKDRILKASDIVDECHLQLSISKDISIGNEASSASLLRYLSETPALLLLDNLDGVDRSVLEFLESLPSPSKALVTCRKMQEIRARIPHVWEIEHIGLTRDEMAELLEIWIRRRPTLGRKIGSAAPGEIDRLLIASNGWPEALVMLLTRLANSLLHIKDLDDVVQEDIYNYILGELYSGLSNSSKKTLLWAGSFPVTFTVSGLARTSSSRDSSVERSLRGLIDSNLVKELFAGQYSWSHPIVKEFVAAKARRHPSAKNREACVEEFLEHWVEVHGGQPTSDWANFSLLDREFENLKVLMERSFRRDDFIVVTRIYRGLFSYIVERGYWMFTEAWCERMSHEHLRKRDRADWLIWWSWIKFYLRRDYKAAAAFAEGALELSPRENRQRFEAHRRALVAYGQLGARDSFVEHLGLARSICSRVWSVDSDEAVDLLNSEASSWFGIGQSTTDEPLYERAMGLYERAERVASRKNNPNTREIGIAMLGEARCLSALGQYDLALERAQGSLGYAWRVSWLRGIAEANELVAELAARLGQVALSRSASDVAQRMGRRLRSTAPVEDVVGPV